MEFISCMLYFAVLISTQLCLAVKAEAKKPAAKKPAAKPAAKSATKKAAPKK